MQSGSIQPGTIERWQRGGQPAEVRSVNAHAFITTAGACAIVRWSMCTAAVAMTVPPFREHMLQGALDWAVMP
jgi:hypothetical protein